MKRARTTRRSPTGACARRALACVLAKVLLVAACATPREPEPLPEPIHLLPVSTWQEDVVLRQRVTIDWPGESAAFDAVLEKRGDRLRLVGLGPMSIPGFVLTLEGDRVEVENRTGRPLVFDPRHVLADVQRVFFPWHPEAARPRRADATRTFERADRTIVESFVAGDLVARDFAPIASPDEVTVVVRFEGWHASPRVPRRARVEHRRLGYRLEVETLSAQRLDPPTIGSTGSDPQRGPLR